MATRNHHSRQSRNDVIFTINKIIVTLVTKDLTVNKSYLYTIKKQILDGKIEIPLIETKTGTSPFLLGYCHKELENKVEFIWI